MYAVSLTEYTRTQLEQTIGDIRLVSSTASCNTLHHALMGAIGWRCCTAA